ncbi:hypothetical protein [Burkholderia ubonensis]|nr:hypothetical protein [Burkholderia ubonensis]
MSIRGVRPTRLLAPALDRKVKRNRRLRDRQDVALRALEHAMHI